MEPIEGLRKHLCACEAQCLPAYNHDDDVWNGGDDSLQPLDISNIHRLFNACDPEHPDYDSDFHQQLFQERPEWFGPDALPIPPKE
jgi:hypothetical protein